MPKRTGRKRKRGTDGPWEEPADQPSNAHDPAASPAVFSRDRLDTPRALRRKLQDNVDKYTVEPIGVINNTHRYRGRPTPVLSASLFDSSGNMAD